MSGPITGFDVDAALIDLDGTLADTIADLAGATNAMLAERGHQALSLARITEFVGKGAAVLVHRALGNALDARSPPAAFEPAMAAFLRHYEYENGRQARLYDGAREGLDCFEKLGLRLACVTNKPQRFADALLRRVGCDHYFHLILGGDALSKQKPDPLPMLYVAEQFGLDPARCLVIGDSVNDAQAARAAGMPVLVVPYGYNEGTDVRSLDVDGIVGSLAEAALLVRRSLAS